MKEVSSSTSECYYAGYQLIEGKHSTVQVWFLQQYRGLCSSVSAAMQYIDSLNNTRLQALIKTELTAMADRALVDIYNSKSSYRPHSHSVEAYKAGQAFFSLKNEAIKKIELQMVDAVSSLLEKTWSFSQGFYYLQKEHQRLSLQQLERDECAFFASKQANQQQQREINKRHLIAQTEMLIPSLQDLKHFEDLVALTPGQLEHLLKIERLFVEDIEAANELSSYDTGGHHRDILSILENVLAGNDLKHCQGMIYMSDEGNLDFDVVGKYARSV